MSYILDALRKADAERDRERASVPDLHAQMLPPAVADDEVAGSGWPRWLGPALLGSLLLGGGMAWWLRGDGPAPPAAAPSVARAPVVAPQAPQGASTVAVPLVAAAAPPVPRPAAATGPAAPTAPAVPTEGARVADARPASPRQVVPAASMPEPRSPSPAAAKAAASAAGPGAEVPDRKRGIAAAPATGSAAGPKAAQTAAPVATPATPTAAPAASAAAAAPTRLPSLAELPDDLRRLVPAMAMGGSVYSPQPTARMLIINGQVFQEGSQLAPELQLEQIRPRSAVFSIRGQRFEVPL